MCPQHWKRTLPVIGIRKEKIVNTNIMFEKLYLSSYLYALTEVKPENETFNVLHTLMLCINWFPKCCNWPSITNVDTYNSVAKIYEIPI